MQAVVAGFTREEWESRMGSQYIPEPNTGCWPWLGIVGTGGYGRIYGQKKMHQAHRIAYELLRGPIPPGLQIDHLCRVRCCVNPDHLRVATNRENTLCGIGVSAMNAAKTHCANGHPLPPHNSRLHGIRRLPWRRCMACERLRRAARSAVEKAATRPRIDPGDVVETGYLVGLGHVARGKIHISINGSLPCNSWMKGGAWQLVGSGIHEEFLECRRCIGIASALATPPATEEAK